MQVFEMPMIHKGASKHGEGNAAELTLKKYYEEGFDVTEDKESVKGYVFGDVINKWRTGDNLKSVSALVFDVDKYHTDIYEDLKKELRGYEVVIYTTHSHNPPEHKYCYRIVIPFERPISKEDLEYEAGKFLMLMPTLERLDKEIVRETLDKPKKEQRVYLDQCYKKPAQYYYKPSCHPNRKQFMKLDYLEGIPFRPNTPKRETTDNVSSMALDMPLESDSRGSDGVLEGNRNNVITSEIGGYIGQGLSYEKVIAKALEYNKHQCNPPLSKHEVLTSVDSIWKTEYKDKPEPKPAPKERGVFRWEGIKDTRQRPPLDWLVSKHVLSKGVMFIYGASQAGKTFVAVDLVASLALKQEWFGMPVKRNVPVRYAAFEDYSGVCMRLDAWRTKHGIDEDLMHEVVKTGGEGSRLMLTDDESVENFLKQLGDFNNGVIVIDTMNRVGGGEDENSAAKMGLLVDNAERISQVTKSLVILVHHTGKDEGRGLRGSTALHAGADLIFEVSKQGDYQQVKFVKIKNSKDGHHIGFGLETVYCDETVYGEENESAVAYHKGEATSSKEVKTLSGHNSDVYKHLVTYLTPHFNKEDDYQLVVNYVANNWVEKHLKKDGTPNDKLDWEVKRVIKALRDKHHVVATGVKDNRSRIWLVEDDKIKITY